MWSIVAMVAQSINSMTPSGDSIMTKINKRFYSVASMLVASSAVFCWSGAGAQATEEVNVLSKRVSYADLNLDSDQGAKVLYTRIRNAAQDVCAPLGGADLARRSQFSGCVSKSIATSVTSVNNSRVTAMYNETMKATRKS